MAFHFQRETSRLKKHILALGARVEETVRRAIQALERRDSDLAQQVIESDAEIDQIEVDVEEECLKILALHQPVAIDLRFIIAVLKINNDLERIGDISVNIAEHAESLAGHDRVNMPFQFDEMATAVQSMLTKSLDALVNMDTELANRVMTLDDQIDQCNRHTFLEVESAIRRHPEQLEQLIRILNVSRNLERIGDLATNIAEDVVYMVRGEIVRHKNVQEGLHGS